MKKILTLFLCLLICAFTFVPAFAEPEEATLETRIITTEAITTERYVMDDEMTNPDEAEENTTIPSEVDIAPETEIMQEDDVVPTANYNSEEETEPETTTAPQEEITKKKTEKQNDGKNAYTTIYIKGLTLGCELKIKNIETGKTYKLPFNKDNQFAYAFEGPEGEYKILSLSPHMVTAKAGKIYDSQDNPVKTLTIKRIDGWQEINLVSSERATFNVGRFILEHWFLIGMLAVLGIAYYIVRQKRVLPSQPV